MATDLERGRAALAAGHWEEARSHFRAAQSGERDPAEAHEGLGIAAWWLSDANDSVHHRERAFVLYRDRGDLERAGGIGIDLVITYLVNLGNVSAAQGWLARTERVAQDLDEGPLHGWLSLMRGYTAGAGDEAERFLETAIRSGRSTGDRDLELVALADLGLALVGKGDTDRGMRLLDESLAGTFAGEGRRPETAVYNSCSMLAACHMVEDLDRAEQWCRIADRFMERYSSPFLFARCRVHYGSLLAIKGRWRRAEDELRAAVDMAEDAGPGPRTEALAGLALLRVRQGRLEEAEELLGGCDETTEGIIAAVELRRARSEPGAAVELLDRWLTSATDHPYRAVALGLLVSSHLDAADVDAAAAALERLRAEADRWGAGGALVALSEGRVLRARGDHGAAALLEEAIRAFTQRGLPFEEACARLELAGALAGEHPTSAASHARMALRAFEQIGATAYSDEAASLLRSMGERVAARSLGDDVLTGREREVLSLVGLGLSNPEIAERLFISRKTVAHHVSSVLAKLGKRNRAELVGYATRQGPTRVARRR